MSESTRCVRVTPASGSPRRRPAPVLAALLVALLATTLLGSSSAAAVVPAVGGVVQSAGEPVVDSGEPATGPTTEPQPRTFVRRSRLLGRSVEGRPLRAYYRGDPRADRVSMVIGSMHGNERAGESTARWMKRHTLPRPGTGVWLLPTMNPDGARAGRRQNAHGVDLNRNWPTSGWDDAWSSCCWGGPSRASEPETRAVKRFLREVRPRRVVSIHQPYGTVAANGESPRFERRLARLLRLPLGEVSIGGPDDLVAPTMSSWFNDRVPRSTMVTVEYTATTTRDYRTRFAGRAVARALRLGTAER